MKTLILIPTEFEADLIRKRIKSDSVINDVDKFPIEVCGFGPVGSAVGSACFINQHRPDQIIAAGIAGRYDDRVEIGKCYQFSNAKIADIGVLKNGVLKTGAELGFPEFPFLQGNEVCHTVVCSSENEPEKEILTVPISSSSREKAADRSELFPNALAEDMESYSIAAMCSAFKIPLIILRGISNDAGDTDHHNWRSREALDAVSESIIQVLNQ